MNYKNILFFPLLILIGCDTPEVPPKVEEESAQIDHFKCVNNQKYYANNQENCDLSIKVNEDIRQTQKRIDEIKNRQEVQHKIGQEIGAFYCLALREGYYTEDGFISYASSNHPTIKKFFDYTQVVAIEDNVDAFIYVTENCKEELETYWMVNNKNNQPSQSQTQTTIDMNKLGGSSN